MSKPPFQPDSDQRFCMESNSRGTLRCTAANCTDSGVIVDVECDDGKDDDSGVWNGQPWNGIVVAAEEDGTGPFPVEAPLYFSGVDGKHHTMGLWNLLVFGMERVLLDLGTESISRSGMSETTFSLLIPKEQAAESAKLLLALLMCHDIKRSVVVDGLLLSIFDRLRESAMVGCCDDPACDLHACLHQMIIGALLTLDLPYPEVKSQCMALLGSEVPILEGAFLNFALDALLVSLIGTTARDFQLAVSHFGDLPAVYDADLADMYGPAYFTPLPPRLNAADLTLLDTLGRSFARGTSVSVAPVATDRIRCAYTQPMVLEKLIGDRMTRLRSLCLMYDRTSVYVGDDSWPPIPNPEQIAATGSVPGGGASGGSTKKKTRPKTANKPSPYTITKEDISRVGSYWKSLNDSEKIASLCLSRSELLQSGVFFGPWLTFRLYLRVLINPLLTAPHATSPSVYSSKIGDGMPLGRTLSVFPNAEVHVIGYSSLHCASATAASRKESLTRLSILPYDVLEPPEWLFCCPNFADETEASLDQALDTVAEADDSDSECGCVDGDSFAQFTCEKHKHDGLWPVIGPATAVLALIEQGCLWLIWQRIVLKARHHETLKQATEKSEQAYAALMAEEELALQKKKKKGAKGKATKAKPVVEPPAVTPAKSQKPKPQAAVKEEPSQPVLRVVEAGGETFMITDDVDVDAIVGSRGDDWVVVGKPSPGSDKSFTESEEKPLPVVIIAANKPASPPHPPKQQSQPAITTSPLSRAAAHSESTASPEHTWSSGSVAEPNSGTFGSSPALPSTLYPSFMNGYPMGDDDDDDDRVLALACGSQLDGFLSEVSQEADDVVQSQSRLLSRLAVAQDTSASLPAYPPLSGMQSSWSSPQTTTLPRPPPGLAPRALGLW